MSDPYSALKQQYDQTWEELHKANEEIDSLRAYLEAERANTEGVRQEGQAEIASLREELEAARSALLYFYERTEDEHIPAQYRDSINAAREAGERNG